MDKTFETYFPYIFPIFFSGMWLFVTSILAIKAKWFDLARRYPNQQERPTLTLRFLSGNMSGVGMGGILRLEACPSGLRVRMNRLFGPFSKDFFVPWNNIQVQRKDRFFWKVADLQFGETGNLQLQDYTADRLWRAVPRQWPETGALPVEAPAQSIWAVFKTWTLRTTLAALFFTIVPRLFFPAGAPYPPFAIAIGLPAFVFGIGAIREFFRRRAR